jgi:hypothetical protein
VGSGQAVPSRSLPAEAVVELHNDYDGVDLRCAHLYIGRIRSVRIGPDEEAVVARPQRVEGEATDAVRGRGEVRRILIATGNHGQHRIMRQRSPGIREGSDDAAETRPESGSQRQADSRPSAPDASRTRASYVD